MADPGAAAGADPSWPVPPEGWRHDAPDPPDAFPVPFTWVDGVVLAIWTLIAQLIVAIPFAASGAEESDPLLPSVFALASQALTLVGAIVWLRGRHVWSWRLLGPVRPRWRHVVIGVGVGVVGYLLVVVLIVMFVGAFGPVEAPGQRLLEESAAGGLVAVLAGLVGVVAAPVVEELIFRGVLFQSLRARVGVFPAMGVSAMVFGAVHFLPLLYSVALAILGFWLAAAFHRTGTLIVPVVAHATFNLIAIVLTVTVV